jgi:hypothetical protein
MIDARMKRIIIQGAMNHDSGAEIAKLLTTTAGIQKKAWAVSAGTLTTKITPIPKTTAFTMHQISAATRSLARLSLSMAFPLSLGKCYSPALPLGLAIKCLWSHCRIDVASRARIRNDKCGNCQNAANEQHQEHGPA